MICGECDRQFQGEDYICHPCREEAQKVFVKAERKRLCRCTPDYLSRQSCPIHCDFEVSVEYDDGCNIEASWLWDQNEIPPEVITPEDVIEKITELNFLNPLEFISEFGWASGFKLTVNVNGQDVELPPTCFCWK